MNWIFLGKDSLNASMPFFLRLSVSSPTALLLLLLLLLLLMIGPSPSTKRGCSGRRRSRRLCLSDKRRRHLLLPEQCGRRRLCRYIGDKLTRQSVRGLAKRCGDVKPWGAALGLGLEGGQTQHDVLLVSESVGGCSSPRHTTTGLRRWARKMYIRFGPHLYDGRVDHASTGKGIGPGLGLKRRVAAPLSIETGPGPFSLDRTTVERLKLRLRHAHQRIITPPSSESTPLTD